MWDLQVKTMVGVKPVLADWPEKLGRLALKKFKTFLFLKYTQ
jgi:hypothetical protein